jgi:hypothetical protein
LAFVLYQDEAALDDIDLVRFFKLTGEDLQLAPALGAHLIGFIEGVHLLDSRKLGLVARTMPRLRLLFVGASLLPIASFALVAEQRLIADTELLLELGNTHLKRPGLPTLQRIDAGLKFEILLDELLVFGFEQRGRLMQALRVTLEIRQRRHSGALTHGRDD